MQCVLLVLCRYYTPAWEAETTYSLKRQSSAVDRETSTGRHKTAALADSAAAAALQQTMQPPGSESTQQVQHSSKGSSAHSQAAGNAAGQGQGLSTDRSFYSFEMGGVHFLMLNTEAPSDPGSPQGRFVAADLAQVCLGEGLVVVGTRRCCHKFCICHRVQKSFRYELVKTGCLGWSLSDCLLMGCK